MTLVSRFFCCPFIRRDLYDGDDKNFKWSLHCVPRNSIILQILLVFRYIPFFCMCQNEGHWGRRGIEKEKIHQNVAFCHQFYLFFLQSSSTKKSITLNTKIKDYYSKIKLFAVVQLLLTHLVCPSKRYLPTCLLFFDL